MGNPSTGKCAAAGRHCSWLVSFFFCFCCVNCVACGIELFAMFMPNEKCFSMALVVAISLS